MKPRSFCSPVLRNTTSSFSRATSSGRCWRRKACVQVLDKWTAPFLTNVGNHSTPRRCASPEISIRGTKGHSVPYMWGTVGIGVNEEAVKKLRPPGQRPTVWRCFSIPSSPETAFRLRPRRFPRRADRCASGPRRLTSAATRKKIGIADIEAVDQALSRVAPFE